MCRMEIGLLKQISCNERNGRLHTPTQSSPMPSWVQELVNRTFVPIFTNHRKLFWQIVHAEYGCSEMDRQSEWWQCSEHKETEFVSS